VLRPSAAPSLACALPAAGRPLAARLRQRASICPPPPPPLLSGGQPQSSRGLPIVPPRTHGGSASGFARLSPLVLLPVAAHGVRVVQSNRVLRRRRARRSSSGRPNLAALAAGDTAAQAWEEVLVRLVRLPRAPGEDWGAGPQCEVTLSAPGADADEPRRLSILSWERHGDLCSFTVAEQSSGRRGSIGQRSGGDSSWVLRLESSAGAADAGAVAPLEPGAVDGLVNWAVNHIPGPAELASDPFWAGLELSSLLGTARSAPILQGDGVVCFEASEFLARLRSTAIREPVVLPFGAIRLRSPALGRLLAAAQAKLRSGGSVDEVASGQSASELLRPLVLAGRCRLFSGAEARVREDGGSRADDLTYFTESPLKSSGWLLGGAAAESPELWQALLTSPAWQSSHCLPLLWTEEDSKVFLGDPGTGTRVHQDILWVPQLAFMLAGEKLLAVSGWQEGGDENSAERVAAPEVAAISVVRALPGDLAAFNASAPHEAANAGTGPTATLYQGFLPLAGVPRFCEAPSEPPRPLSRDSGCVRHDGTWEVLRPPADTGQQPLVETLALLRAPRLRQTCGTRAAHARHTETPGPQGRSCSKKALATT